jgi:hypothetical protein
MNLLDMYEMYIKEVEGSDCVKTDFGFAIFKYLPDDICYITEIFIHPNHRGIDKYKILVDLVVEKARKKEVKYLYGSVGVGIKNSSRSIKMILDYGMKLKSCDQNIIYFCKEI